MRIALVGLTHPFRGGIAHYTTLLYRALAERHDVRFFALSRQYPSLLFPGKTQIDESAEGFRVPHEACLDSINPFTWFGTGRRIRRFGPDLVLFSWWHPFFAPSFGTVARRAGAPCCFLCHNVLPHESSFVDRVLLRYAYRPVRAFITHSREDAENLEAFRPGAPVRTSPHPSYDAFVPPEDLTADDAKARLGLAGKRVLLFFGFIRAYKGLDLLLAAMRDLPEDEHYHVLVVGEFYDDRGSYEPALTELIDAGRLTLVDRYVPNEEVPRFFMAADLVVCPYHTATQSGIVQIAYGFRKPVVATRVGGLPEVVFDGRTGAIVPPGDAPALAAAVRNLLEAHDPDDLVAGIEEADGMFSWDRMVETVEAIAGDLDISA